eukprot:scaffold28572_cov90-Isochrysis_galbana.AAC.1
MPPPCLTGGQLAEALTARDKLAEARAEAKRRGWRADWWEGRPADEPYAGLGNQGATCYLNSLLQALFALPEVRAVIYGFEYDASRHGPADLCVPLQLSRLFARMQCSRARVCSTRELTASFGWSAADSFQQHDIQELCRVLFDALDKFGVPLGRLFQGETARTRVCLTCGHRWGGVEAWFDVGLDVGASRSLEESLGQLVAWETLDGDNAVLCESCGVPRGVSLSEHFTSAPSFLMVHLKRFVFDVASLSRRKLQHRVSFPSRFSLEAFGPQPLQGGGEGSQLEGGAAWEDRHGKEGTGAGAEAWREERDDVGAEARVRDGGSRERPRAALRVGAASAGGGEEKGFAGGGLGAFECVGALVHSGSAQGGHYYALLRRGERGGLGGSAPSLAVESAGEAHVTAGDCGRGGRGGADGRDEAGGGVSAEGECGEAGDATGRSTFARVGDCDEGSVGDGGKPEAAGREATRAL